LIENIKYSSEMATAIEETLNLKLKFKNDTKRILHIPSSFEDLVIKV